MNVRNSRQSFLGQSLDEILAQNRIGIVGLGGGGSIVCTFLGHIGFKKYYTIDPDLFEESNINRLVGGQYNDIISATPKVEIASRAIRSIVPDANIIAKKNLWQECINDEELKKCSVIFSCLDDFSNRIQLESFCRRHKIPLIDIGMTIKNDGDNNYTMMGQVILSHPNGPCFKCSQYITDNDLELEAGKYGDAGARPQVIWPNGVLASTAVGLAIELLTQWTKKEKVIFYKRFDGNSLILKDDLRSEKGMLNNICHCYP